MELTAALSANAGVSLTIDGTRFWIDALHNRKTGTFSCLSEELFGQMLRDPHFVNPDFLLFTHRHPDHYSHELTVRAKEAFPEAFVLGPLAEYPGPLAFSEPEFTWQWKNLEFHFFKSYHEGAEYASVRNFGFWLRVGGFTLLVPGDSALDSPEITASLKGQAVDLALVNFPWVTLTRGRRRLNEELQPEHLWVCHLPFAEDDMNHYRELSRRAEDKLLAGDVRLLMDPLQAETLVL